ncbi:MAG TPA: DUF892 family protein, partial [Oscillatoriaceae cyanobacterium]
MAKTREDFKNKLMGYIEDAWAMENQIAQVLEGQIKDLESFPEFQTRIRQHLEETKLHRKRMAERLSAYGRQPTERLTSEIKGVVGGLLGMATGALQGMRADTLAREVRDDFVTENLEVAAYTMLIACARAFGDDETVQAAEANLREDIQMQRWLADRLSDAALLSLDQQGIPVPAGDRQPALDEADAQLRVVFEPIPGLGV